MSITWWQSQNHSIMDTACRLTGSLQRSSLQPSAQSRLSRGLKPGCSVCYLMGAENRSRRGWQHLLRPNPTAQPSLWEKSFPLSPAPLILLCLLPTRSQNLLPRAAPSHTSIAVGALPPWDRAAHCSGPTSMETLLALSSHWSQSICTVALLSWASTGAP